jgi:hypothetical protein
MIGEMDIAGVFIPRILVAAIAAFVISLAARHLFRRMGLYRFVWHAGLFDTAIFVVAWWLVAMATVNLTPYGSVVR